MKAYGYFGLLFLVACGGYDAAYDCEQSAACEEKMKGRTVSDAEIEMCTDLSEALYDSASGAAQDQADEVFEACSDKEACAYVVCACDEVGKQSSTCDEARKHQ